MRKRKIFIGVAWPYVNGELHVGHQAGYLLPADITARYHRAVKDNVLMVSGSDCYGTPITLEADKRGVSPREIVNEYHAKDEELLLRKLHLSYDIYTRTDTKNHTQIVQDMFLKLLKNGYIFIGSSRQYYSDKEGKFIPDRYVEGTCKFCGYTEARSDQCDRCSKLLDEENLKNPHSRLGGGVVQIKESKHYFLDWPKLQPQIEKYVKERGRNWKNWIYRETLGWFSGEGLKPRAISRDIDWGVPLPVDRIPENMRLQDSDHKRFYVWFDAVIGYLSASKLWSQGTAAEGQKWKDFWYDSNVRHLYFMGKDNLPFHALFWPGQLIGSDSKLHLPDILGVNMFLDLEGQKFSKSRGVTLPLADVVSYFGNDPIRFYLTYVMPEKKDSSFRWGDFLRVNNEILIASFGNYINRTLFLGVNINMEQICQASITKKTQEQIRTAFISAKQEIEGLNFREYLKVVIRLADYGNRQINEHKIYRLKKNSDSNFFLQMKQMYAVVISLAYLIIPLMPETSVKIFSLLGLPESRVWPETGELIPTISNMISSANNKRKPKPLFRKLTPEDIEKFNTKLINRLGRS